MIVYGIPNCNTVKKARTWLSENEFTPEFHDFKKNGITADKLRNWCNIFGWEKVLNKKGTTWRGLSTEEQESVIDQESAIRILLKYTSAIKRPIVEVDGKPVLISFEGADYIRVLK
ncbi:MAG TPA: arsenate reductase [Pedobacter sp.]|uniref:arsenate reductase n=1 Tax=Pedobacter sp. TaxID=1411316 RepID=UPI002BDD3BD7|nr:arsenate reductase [Pedobacter sp.]HMI03837.1 arsenate reductase [Pedobacter sp.]